MACCCLVGRPLSFLKCCGGQSRPSAAKRDSESPSAAQKDGSVSWRGEVEETGERAVLMLWNNALLSGYFAYKGTVFTIEGLGGGVHVAAEMDPLKLPLDHPPAAARDSAPISTPNQQAT